jgi:hypothetical protein
MAINELQRLRMSYAAAHTAHLSCLQAVYKTSEQGERPTDQLLRSEQLAFNDLVNAREAFFDKLLRYGNAPHLAVSSS